MVTALMLLLFTGCEKELAAEAVKVKPPVRTYVVTARADKRGTNSTSPGTAVLSGTYNEETKLLSYSIEFAEISPRTISMRYGPRGSVGTFVRELYNSTYAPGTVIKGSFSLTPLQERNMLKGLWSVSVSTAAMSPEISGFLTLKQQ